MSGNPVVEVKTEQMTFDKMRYGARFILEPSKSRQTEIWTKQSPKSTKRYGANALCANGSKRNFADNDVVYELPARGR